ncbi:hypothetical protein HanRHA438_Chr09g0399961 [Helianthus annuus]|nr:hypothetical protein HanIR_Chr09g0418791 [Helianthus annuus]KAJ0888255.1 hypothetical protein HanRHA438_Chr09g0399961 [Helianthus annuus]
MAEQRCGEVRDYKVQTTIPRLPRSETLFCPGTRRGGEGHFLHPTRFPNELSGAQISHNSSCNVNGDFFGKYNSVNLDFRRGTQSGGEVRDDKVHTTIPMLLRSETLFCQSTHRGGEGHFLLPKQFPNELSGTQISHNSSCSVKGDFFGKYNSENLDFRRDTQRGGEVRDDKVQTKIQMLLRSETLFCQGTHRGREGHFLRPKQFPNELPGAQISHSSSRNVDGNFFGNYNSENLDFGRDTNRLDYFSVTAFDICEKDETFGIASYGGGGGGSGKLIGGDEVGGVRPLQWWKKCWLTLTCKGV